MCPMPSGNSSVSQIVSISWEDGNTVLHHQAESFLKEELGILMITGKYPQLGTRVEIEIEGIKRTGRIVFCLRGSGGGRTELGVWFQREEHPAKEKSSCADASLAVDSVNVAR